MKLYNEKEPLTKNFTLTDLNFFFDARLNWRAKGLLIYLSSRPAGWELRISDLINKTEDAKEIGGKPDGKDTIYSILNELETAGYIKKNQLNIKGKFQEAFYTLIENPLPVKYTLPFTELTEPARPFTVEPEAVTPEAVNPQPVKINNKKSVSKLPAKADNLPPSDSLPVGFEPFTVEPEAVTPEAVGPDTVTPDTGEPSTVNPLHSSIDNIDKFNFNNINIFNSLNSEKKDEEIKNNISVQILEGLKLIKFRFKTDYQGDQYEKILISFINKFNNYDRLYQALEQTKYDLNFDQVKKIFPPDQNPGGYFHTLINSETFNPSPNLVTNEQRVKINNDRAKFAPVSAALGLSSSVDPATQETDILNIILAKVYGAKTGFRKTAETNILSEVAMLKTMNKIVTDEVLTKINDRYYLIAENSENDFKIMVQKILSAVTIFQLKPILQDALKNNYNNPRFKKYLSAGVDGALTAILSQFSKYSDTY